MDTLAALILIAIFIAVFVVAYSLTQEKSSSASQFKPILNLNSIQNSNQLMQAIQLGLSNYSNFNITYYGSATLLSGLPLRYTANLSISRNVSLFKINLSTGNPNIFLPAQYVSNTYKSISEYNGTGFLLCTDLQQTCEYTKSIQNDNFSGELASSLSNLFSSSFLMDPYLTSMSDNYSSNLSSSFVLAYTATVDHNGNQCAYDSVKSTQSFTATSGLSIEGNACFSYALGLPLYGQLTITYHNLNVQLSFDSILSSNS
jgi:hypothetical protein